MLPLEQFNQIMEALTEIKDRLAEMNKYRFAEQYIDNEQFCSLLNINDKTARLWRKQGILPYAQLGRKIYYRLSDIEEQFLIQFQQPKRLEKKAPSKRRRLKNSRYGNGWEINLKRK